MGKFTIDDILKKNAKLKAYKIDPNSESWKKSVESAKREQREIEKRKHYNATFDFSKVIITI